MLECSPTEGVVMAEYTLRGAAKKWWEFFRYWDVRYF